MGATLSKDSLVQQSVTVITHQTWMLSRTQCVTSFCGLCKESNENKNYRLLDRCSHVFHRACLRDHRKRFGAECPTCDAPYSDVKTETQIQPSPLEKAIMNVITSRETYVKETSQPSSSDQKDMDTAPLLMCLFVQKISKILRFSKVALMQIMTTDLGENTRRRNG